MTKRAGFEPIVIRPEVSENLPDPISPRDAVMLLSLRKALSVKDKLTGTENSFTSVPAPDIPLIIAADTVVYENSILGKPTDKSDAERMLMSLAGTSHLVLTGVTISDMTKDHTETFCEITKVFFKQYTAADLKDYLDTTEAYDKAGAYAIQGWFSRYVDHIEGDYDNVVGLPVARVIDTIGKFNINK